MIRAYYMRLEVAEAAAAEALVEALEETGPVLVQRRECEILLLWPATDAMTKTNGTSRLLRS
jgi:hypothetical protein